jgi:L-lactate dehydrogenase
MTKKRIVGVIGIGHVGAHVAYTLGMRGVADVVKLCDTNEQKLISERQDLMDAVMFMPHRVNYVIAKYEELADCDVIINAIGKIELLVTHNRDTEMNFTVAQVADFIPKVMAGGFKGIFINITNPCDVVTDLIYKLSGLPKGHVFGTGTGLDSSRLVSAIAQQTGLDHKSITAYMMGEHGNAQMVPWSVIKFGGKPLSELEGDPRFVFNKDEIKEKTIKAGWVTYVGKGCTEYGICATAVTLANTVLHDEKRIMATSCPLDGEYGEKGIFAGCPSVVGADGVEQVMEYSLPEDEMAEFKKCCATIRANIKKAEAIWKK